MRHASFPTIPTQVLASAANQQTDAADRAREKNSVENLRALCAVFSTSTRLICACPFSADDARDPSTAYKRDTKLVKPMRSRNARALAEEATPFHFVSGTLNEIGTSIRIRARSRVS